MPQFLLSANNMSLIVRIIHFIRRENGWLLAAWLGLIAILIYRYPTSTSAAILLGFCSLCFGSPYIIRSKVVLNYRVYRRGVSTFLFVVIASLIAMRFVGYRQAFHFGIAAYYSLALGLIFWAASDPMFEMVEWLAFPTEFGRVPDEIQLFDARRIDWPGYDFPIDAQLFRFRYGDKWDYGLTGPLTFAFGDNNFEGKPTEEIYAAYADWYEKQGIGEKIVDAAVE